MVNTNQTDPRKNFVPRFLPWLLAAAAFVVYCLTLNHWVSILNLANVTKVSGWTWQPEVVNPITFLVTIPFRWLPAAAIPVALNLFSALCAALTLGLLARSVAILPHDRTDAQRAREQNGFSFLTIWSAWLPPVLAVAVCGLQLTFWEHATNFSGEMFDLLLFAFVIWSLLEYRIDEREGRLFLGAFIYGAGMTNNWAMVNFLPVFVGAVIWMRGLSFFNARFLTRMALCGLVGILFYLLLPLLANFSHTSPVPFWQALKYNLSSQFAVIRTVFMGSPLRSAVIVLSLTSLLPLLVFCIRWPGSFGDNSPAGRALTSFMFHLAHAVFLCACVWAAFDSPISPRHRGLGLPFLTFYYLGALCVGYYSGYFLLVFGSKSALNRAHRLTPMPFEFLNRPIVVAVWVIAFCAVAILIYKNAPQVRASNSDTFRQFGALIEKTLPATGGILLSDEPSRLVLAQAALARTGRTKDFVPIETASLKYPSYHKFLHRTFPQIWPDTVAPAEMTNGIGPLHLMALMAALIRTNDVYYLHPSFGYYFEEFYLEPHGLIYKLKTLPRDTLLPPLPDNGQIADNETFWSQAQKTAFAPVEFAVAPPSPVRSHSFGERVLDGLHLSREKDLNAILAGTFYSRALDFWGVQLQRAGELNQASNAFVLAQQLNPDNAVADINLDFNQKLRADTNAPVDLTKISLDQFGKYHTWNEIYTAYGPFDEPTYCFADGMILARGNLLRQAIAPFERVRQLLPDNVDARLWLGQLYVANRLPDRALAAVNDLQAQPEKFSLTETNEMQLAIIQASACFQKTNRTRGIQLLETQISRHPADSDLLGSIAQVYVSYGIFSNALDVIDRRLAQTPDDPAWLMSKGQVCLQLKSYDQAIAVLNRVLELQTTNSQALYFRASAYLADGKLDAAQTDFETLQNTFTNSLPVVYGLGEVAWRKHDTNAAIKNYEFLMAHVNTNAPEVKTVLERLRELKK
ncbi:MAG TPA: tetratricopeptide repeat protein [Verrucomicrobiae bacterium]|nr:tetratricopeptide repeat protein [Verrucomicrobiae bacterium]